MTLEEIKLRQLTNQYLINPGVKAKVVKDLCGIQAQFMANAYHSLKIRCNECNESDFGENLIKNWTIRGTVHIFHESDLPIFINCDSGKNYLKNVWDDRSFWNQRENWHLTPERQSYLSDVIVNALKKKSHTRDELKEICREKGMTPAEESSMFDPWGGGVRELCERGFINYKVKEEKEFALTPKYEPLEKEKAELILAERYFRNFAPATIHDAMYFFNTTKKKVKSWIENLPIKSLQFGGKTYFYIENGKNYNYNIPDVLFLAGFDQLMLGYEKKENLYLKSEHLRGIFNLAGIVMPPLLLRGEVIGKWKNQNGKLMITTFENIYSDDVALIKDNAENLFGSIKRIEFI